MDRLLVGVQQRDNFWKNNKEIENTGPVVICLFEANEGATYNTILAMLRSAGIKSEIYSGDGSIKAQMKYADKRNSPAVILYGDNEIKTGKATLKSLETGNESSVEIEDLANEIKKLL